MLKTKHMVILAVVLCVLAGVSFLQRTSHQRSTNRPTMAVLLDGAWTTDDLSRVTLGYGDDTEALVLERTPEDWILPSAWNAAASTSRLDGLLRALGGLSGEYRSDSADVLESYGLGEGQALTVRAWGADGAEVIALDVGLKAAGAQGQFVRRPGETRVYQATADVLATLGLYDGPGRPRLSHFLDLEVVQEDRAEVETITLWDATGERTFTKEFPTPEPAADDTTGVLPQPDRQTWEWRLTAPTDEPLAKTRADGVLGSLVTIRGVDVEDPTADPAVYGLADPERRARLVFADGRELTLLFGNTRAAAGDKAVGVRMRIDGDPTVWIVTEYTVNNIFKATDELRPGI